MLLTRTTVPFTETNLPAQNHHTSVLLYDDKENRMQHLVKTNLQIIASPNSGKIHCAGLKNCNRSIFTFFFSRHGLLGYMSFEYQIPKKHNKVTLCYFIAGLPLTMLTQHWVNGHCLDSLGLQYI